MLFLPPVVDGQERCYGRAMSYMEYIVFVSVQKGVWTKYIILLVIVLQSVNFRGRI